MEWLLGLKRAASFDLSATNLAILPSQFAEICVFFLRRDPEFSPQVLAAIELEMATEQELLDAALLWIRARALKKKASLADAMIAAVVRGRGDMLLSFDHDFATLGLVETSPGLWAAASTSAERPRDRR